LPRGLPAESAGLNDEAGRLYARALGHWRGPALASLPGRLLTNSAALLNDQRLSAVEKMAAFHLRCGDARTPISHLAGLVAEHPYRESLRALLMKALDRAGRQVEALAVFEEGRRLLAQELGLDPGPLLMEAHQLALGAGTENKYAPHSSPQSGTAPTGPPDEAESPRRVERTFLPRDITEFTGRRHEIHRLLTEARRTGANAPIIQVIDGMGGVGKTTLAVHLAHQLTGDFPDGQYFVDLDGFSAGNEPLNPLQALNLLLRSSGTPPELVPSVLEDCIALWRSRLAGLRVLILLDNALDTAQVRPLLPGTPGLLVLISSRNRMASLEGAESLSLGIMRPDEAVALFESIVGHERIAAEPEAARTAVELCGLLPLAIQIAAARLRARVGWPVSYLVGQLQSHKSRAKLLSLGDRDVMDVLTWSYRHLQPCQQRLFRLLGLHPGPDFDAHPVAALADLSLDDAETCLDELFEVNLVNLSAPGQYHLHDLVRDCSRTLLDEYGAEAEGRSATRRIIDYYLRSVSRWCSAISGDFFPIDIDDTQEPRSVKEPESGKQAIELIEAEYRNIAAVSHIAADLGHHEQAWRLICFLIPYFATVSYAGEAQSLLRTALSSAREAGAMRGESICLTGLASAKRNHAELGQAEELAKQALDLGRRIGDRRGEILQLSVLGSVYWDDSQLDKALVCFVDAMETAQAVGDLRAQALLANNLGNVSWDSGRMEEALQYFRKSQSLDDGSSKFRLRIRTLVNIGHLLLFQGSDDEATAHFEQALDLSRSANDNSGNVLARIGLGNAKRIARDFPAALDYGREALELAQGFGMYNLEIDALNALGDIHTSLGNLTAAEQVFHRALDVAAANNSSRYAAQSREGLAHVASARADADTARNLWQQALAAGTGGVLFALETERHAAAPEPGAETCWRCRLS